MPCEFASRGERNLDGTIPADPFEREIPNRISEIIHANERELIANETLLNREKQNDASMRERADIEAKLANKRTLVMHALNLFNWNIGIYVT